MFKYDCTGILQQRYLGKPELLISKWDLITLGTYSQDTGLPTYNFKGPLGMKPKVNCLRS